MLLLRVKRAGLATMFVSFGQRQYFVCFFLLAIGIEVAWAEGGLVEPVFDIVNQLLRKLSVHELHEGSELSVLWLLAVGHLVVTSLGFLGCQVLGPVVICIFNGALSGWGVRGSY